MSRWSWVLTSCWAVIVLSGIWLPVFSDGPRWAQWVSAINATVFVLALWLWPRTRGDRDAEVQP